MYALDTSIRVQSGSMKRAVRKLDDALELLEPWYNELRIKFDVNKCSIRFVFKGRSHFYHHPSPLEVFHTNINWTNQINYLGVILDSKLTYRSHINRSLRQLCPILNKSSNINANLALIICVPNKISPNARSPWIEIYGQNTLQTPSFPKNY
jgi:hypothetical protein